MRKDYIEKLVLALNKNEIDAALVVPSEELKFLSGHSPSLCERFQGLFVKNDGSYFYFCNLLTRDEAYDAYGEGHVYYWNDNEIFTEVLTEVLGAKGLLKSTIAVNKSARAFNVLEIIEKVDVNFVNGKSIFEEMTLIKTLEEFEMMRYSAGIADRVIKKAIEYIRPGMLEGEIIDKVKELFIEEGGVPDFAIISSGPNSALPHYNGNSRKIEENDIVLLDIGCKYKGLSSDITRTVFVGEPTDKMKKVYQLVLDANTRAEETAGKGIHVAEVDSAARDIISEAGYGEYFTTRLGHGIGYSTHEAPDIKQSSDRILDNGMAFSIEPGIYIKDEFGVRIEDILVIDNDKTEVLNKMTKEMIIIK